MTIKKSNLKRSQYMEQENFARDLHCGGGPELGDLDSLGCGAGPHSQLLRAIWGNSKADFEKAIEYERALEQRQRRHIFVNKRRLPRAARTRKTRGH